MNRIKELREAKKMTQVRLSIELDVSQETVSAYEKGKYYPSYQSLIRLSEIFNTSIDYIMGLSDKKISDRNLTDIENDALHLFKSLNTTQKEKVLSYMEGLLDR